MTKAELQEYGQIQTDCISLKYKLDEMRSRMIFPKIPVLTGMPHGTTMEDRMAKSIAEYLEASQQYADKLDELTERLNYIEACINQLPTTRERTLLRNRYINGMKWEEICVAMNYSWQHLHRIHALALLHIRDIE